MATNGLRLWSQSKWPTMPNNRSYPPVVNDYGYWRSIMLYTKPWLWRFLCHSCEMQVVTNGSQSCLLTIDYACWDGHRPRCGIRCRSIAMNDGTPAGRYDVRNDTWDGVRGQVTWLKHLPPSSARDWTVGRSQSALHASRDFWVRDNPSP